MIHGGAKVDAQTTVGNFHSIGGHVERSIAADHIEDIQIFNNRFAFDRHIEHPRADGLPVKLGHFQSDVVGAISDRQFVTEGTPAPALIKGIFICAHYRNRQAGEISACNKWQVGLINTSVFAVRYAAGADRENDIVIRVFVGQRLSVTDAEIIQIDTGAGKFDAESRSARVKGDGRQFHLGERGVADIGNLHSAHCGAIQQYADGAIVLACTYREIHTVVAGFFDIEVVFQPFVGFSPTHVTGAATIRFCRPHIH